MAFISSYAQLNKKYNLNFSDNNYGFSWDIFKAFVGDEWAEYFTTNCFYRFIPTARGTRKTSNCLAFDLFICCNFNDSSVQEVRRYENTHSETTIGALMNVCQVLLDKYNINLLPNNPHGIKWKITKDGGCIIFPNNQQIDFIGYANGNKIFGKEVGGSSFLGSRTDEIIMAEEKETLTEKQLTYRYEIQPKEKRIITSNNTRIVYIADPEQEQDAVNKRYVDKKVDEKQDKENWKIIGKSINNREYAEFKLNFNTLYRTILTWEKPPFNQVNLRFKVEFKTGSYLGGSPNDKIFLTKGLINDEEAILYLQFLGNNKWQLIIEGGNEKYGNIYSLEELQNTIKIDINQQLKITSKSLKVNELAENNFDIELPENPPKPSIPQWIKVADVFCENNKDWITYNCLPDKKYKIWYNISPTNCTPSSEHTFMSQEFVYSYNQKVPAIVIIVGLDNKLLKLEKGNPDKFGWDNNSYGNLWKLEELQE